MSMNISGIPGQTNNKAKAIGAGAVLGMVGMNAYFLPVTKDRFVRTAFNLVRENTEDTIDRLNESAVQIANKRISPENKLFLAQSGIAECVDAINTKCVELKKSVTDTDAVKLLKKNFEDNFKSFKKSEALMDSIASDTFSRIRWTNFTWGTIIGFILGCVMASQAGHSAQVPYQIPQE